MGQRLSRAKLRRYNRHGISRGPSISRAATGYTITHAGRQIRLGPVAFWIAVGTVIIMAGWSLTSATYFAFRDDVLRGLLARQAEQQYAYEDRIAELRARLDRTTSRQLARSGAVRAKTRGLAAPSRNAGVAGVGFDRHRRSGDDRVDQAFRARRPTEPTTKTWFGRDHQSFLDPDWMQTGRKAANRRRHCRENLAHAEASLDRIERRQSLALAQIQERYEGKARKLRNVFADLGLKVKRTADGGKRRAIRAGQTARRRQQLRAGLTRSRYRARTDGQLNRALVYVPVRKPVSGEIDLSSQFGVRVDPFLRIPAMHTGLDFRGEIGDPIHATAAGTVTAAGWTGGYGKMVEIDHGNGLSTRYGHLSQIDVSVGDKIRVGQIVGRLGSTGRSTGPHVHYETRIDGEPVDPQKFLNAGARLEGTSTR